MIQVRDLSIQYHGSPVLQDVCLDVRRGECVLVTGPSGCGKSTLARAICGLIPHVIPAREEGEIRLAGLDVRRSNLATLIQRVGMVFQNPSMQLSHGRVEDEVAFGPQSLGWEKARVKESVAWALETTGLARLKDRRPAELSGGEKQCLAIAAALAMQSEVLVLDEPTASLDVPSAQRVIRALRLLRERHNITIVIIEHRLAEVVQLVDRVLVMNAGRVQADGNPVEVLAERNIRELLGLSRPAGEHMTHWISSLPVEEPDGKRQSEPLLALEKVSAGYGHRTIVNDIDLTLYPGDCVGLVGANGSGKSTLALVAAGLVKPTRGQVRYRNGCRPQLGSDVAMLFQNPSEQLFTDSVNEEVSFAPRRFGRFEESRHGEVLDAADLRGVLGRRPTTLSAGQQQRTALAACLALAPRVLILDEPTLGEDWRHLERLVAYLKRLNRQGTAILLISHDYQLLHQTVRRIAWLQDGRIKRMLPAVSPWECQA